MGEGDQIPGTFVDFGHGRPRVRPLDVAADSREDFLQICLTVDFAVNLRGNPPALLEDSQSLTVPGIATSLQTVNRSHGHGKETDRERLPEPQSYQMGMQISRGLYPQRAAQGVVRPTARRLGRGVPGA